MKEGEVGDGIVDRVEEEEIETNIAGSEEMEIRITGILEKIENFTQLVPILNSVLSIGLKLFRARFKALFR